jgi:hypothetical protein
MMNQNSLRPLRPLLILFILISGFLVAGRSILAKWQIDQEVFAIGNLIVFATVFSSFLLLRKATSSPNPQAFVRAMYGSFIIKFFVLALVAFIYIMAVKKNVNKPALFGCIGLYFIYTFLEISAILKLLKEKKNA